MYTHIQRKTAVLANHAAENEIRGYSLPDAILKSTENIAIFSLDKKYCYTSFNLSHSRNMKKVWGVDIKTGMNLLDCINIPELKVLLKRSVDRALLGETFSEVQSKPGENIYYEFFWNPVFKNKKIIGVTAFVINITDRKLAELALLKNEEDLKQGEIFAKFGNWRLDLNEQILYASAGAQKIYGYESEKITLTELKAFRLPEYDRFLDEAMMNLIGDKEPYDVEFKIKRKSDGKIIDIHSKAEYNAVTNTIFGTIQDITERKKAQQDLLKSELLYSSVLTASPDGIVITDLEGRLQLVSPSALRLLGYNHQLEVLGKQLTDFVIPDNRERILANLAIMFEQKKSSSGEYMGLCSDGDSLPLEVNTSFIRNEAGEPTNLITIIRDITERKKAEDLLQESRLRYEALSNGAYEAIFLSENHICLEQNQMAEKMFGYTCEEAVGKNVAGWIAPQDRDRVIKNVDQGFEDPYEVTALRKDGTTFPCMIRGKQMNYKGRTVRVSSLTDITENKRSEALKQEAQDRLLKISKSVPGLIYQYRLRADGSSCIPFASEAIHEIYRVAPDEVREDASKLFANIHPDDIEGVYASIHASAKELLPWQHEYRVKFADGTIRFHYGNAIPQREEDGSVLWNGFVTDITAKKEAEKELIATQLFNQDIINTIPVRVFWKDTNLVYQGCNELFARDAGFNDPKDIIGKNDFDMGWKNEAELYRIDDRDVLEHGIAKMLIEEALTNPQGKIVSLLTNKIPLRNADGAITGILGTYIDITERKLAEAQQREAQDRIIKIARHVPGIIFQFRMHQDGAFTFPYISESLYDIFKMRPEEFYADAKSAFDRIHPEYLAAFEASIALSASSMTPWQHECRIILKDGSERHIYGSSVPEPEPDGSVLWNGFITDITEHKFTEERIRQLSKAVDQSPVSIVITDINGAIQYVNPKFVELTGYSVDELLGKNPRILKSGYTSDEEYKKLWEAISHGETWRGDLQNKKKNGELYWESASISPVINEQGETTHFLAVKEDITERVAFQQKLEQSIRKYEFVNKATSDTIWEWDFKAGTIFHSENFTKTFGYAAGTIVNSKQWANQNIHPDDYKRVEDIIACCIEHKLEHWQAEYRYCAADGTYKYVYDRAFILFDGEGNPSRMYGSMTDLTEKQNLKMELADQQLKQQKQLLEVNIQAHEEEKSELGKELHDNISQMLATVKMYLGLVKAGRSIPEFDLVGKSYEYVEETISELRKLSHSLVPPSLGEIGLQQALKDLIQIANRVKEMHIKLEVDKKIMGFDFGKKMELMIYRIVQEQLNNINKYAQAKNVTIIIKKMLHGLRLTISDDGIGFDKTKKGNGIGLRNMVNRVEFYSGKLDIVTAPGEGCSIIVSIPFDFNKKAK